MWQGSSKTNYIYVFVQWHMALSSWATLSVIETIVLCKVCACAAMHKKNLHPPTSFVEPHSITHFPDGPEPNEAEGEKGGGTPIAVWVRMVGGWGLLWQGGWGLLGLHGGVAMDCSSCMEGDPAQPLQLLPDPCSQSPCPVLGPSMTPAPFFT